MNQLCKVCGEPAAGFHFGAFTCEGCKSFFGRTCNNVSGISECKNGGRCEINKKNRTACKQCRLRKCLSVGMSKSGSRYGRRSNWFKIHCLLTSQNGGGGGSGGGGGMNSLSSAEANNNNSTATNNNNNNPHSIGMFPSSHSSEKSPTSSTITSLGSFSSGSSLEERESDRRTERERIPSSHHNNVFRNGMGVNEMPPTLSSMAAGLSPESREQFLESLNQKLINPEFANLFRAASIAGLGGFIGPGGFPMPVPNLLDRKHFMERDDDQNEEDLKRARKAKRSPRASESPKSEASDDDGKPQHPLLSLPPESPTDLKPDSASIDYLMKMGYDSMRMWPAAMLSAAPANLPQFNPYRFMFPGAFPGASFPPGIAFPPATALPQQPFPSKLFPTAAAAAGLPEGILPSALTNFSNVNMFGASRDSLKRESESCSPRGRISVSPPLSPGNRNSPLCLSSKGRVTPVASPSSNLTLTPPISHHSSDEHLQEKRSSLQCSEDMPIDLSAKPTANNNNNNNEIKKDYFRHKRFMRVNGALSPRHSDSEDDQ